MGLDSVVVGISTMLVFWPLASLVRNSVVLAVYLLFSVACFFTVHEHSLNDSNTTHFPIEISVYDSTGNLTTKITNGEIIQSSGGYFEIDNENNNMGNSSNIFNAECVPYFLIGRIPVLSI